MRRLLYIESLGETCLEATYFKESASGLCLEATFINDTLAKDPQKQKLKITYASENPTVQKVKSVADERKRRTEQRFGKVERKRLQEAENLTSGS